VLERVRRTFDPGVRILRDQSAVSLIGTGITDRHQYLLNALALQRDAGMTITGLQTSSFRISFIIERSRMREAVQMFHKHFIEAKNLE